MDRLRIADLEIRTRIGVSDEERTHEQRLLVSVDMHLDLQKTGASDDVADSIDYDALIRDIQEEFLRERRTIEAAAEAVASLALRPTACRRVAVTITKFPYPENVSVSASIERERQVR